MMPYRWTAKLENPPLVRGLRSLSSHPLVVVLATAILTGLLAPGITRRWQDRQKELELKTELVSELSEAVMQIVMAVQFVEVRQGRTDLFPVTAEQQKEFDEAYRLWEIRRAVLGTKLAAYFPGTRIFSSWGEFSELITEFYAMQGGPRGQREHRLRKLHERLTPAPPSANDEAAGKADDAGEEADQADDEEADEADNEEADEDDNVGWLTVKDGILRRNADLIGDIMASPIRTFR